MTKAMKRGILAVVTVIVLLALGVGLGSRRRRRARHPHRAGDPDGTRRSDGRRCRAGGARTASSPPSTRPTGPRFDAALESLLGCHGRRPERAGEASLTVVAGDGDEADETYRLDRHRRRHSASRPRARPAPCAASTTSPRRCAPGGSVTEHLGEEVTSRLPFRMVDMGAVGVEPDPAAWEAGTDYSHASKAFADVLLPEAPYIDEAALAEAFDDFDEFVRHSLANGYNAVAFPGFVEFVTFDEVAGRPGLRRGRRAPRAGARAARRVRPVLGRTPTSSAWMSSSAPTCSR